MKLEGALDNQVDVGNLSVDTEVIEEGGPEPVDLGARVAAHLGHRIPGISRIEKRLEGADKTSGILSDTLALTVNILRRNKPAIESALKNFLAEYQRDKAAQAAEKAAQAAPTNGGEQ